MLSCSEASITHGEVEAGPHFRVGLTWLETARPSYLCQSVTGCLLPQLGHDLEGGTPRMDMGGLTAGTSPSSLGSSPSRLKGTLSLVCIHHTSSHETFTKGIRDLLFPEGLICAKPCAKCFISIL